MGSISRALHQRGLPLLLGTVAAGLLGQAVGIIPVLAIQGGGYVAAGLAVLAALRGRPGAGSRRLRPLLASSPRQRRMRDARS